MSSLRELDISAVILNLQAEFGTAVATEESKCSYAQ
jgi:hypothetical protein